MYKIALFEEEVVVRVPRETYESILREVNLTDQEVFLTDDMDLAIRYTQCRVRESNLDIETSPAGELTLVGHIKLDMVHIVEICDPELSEKVLKIVLQTVMPDYEEISMITTSLKLASEIVVAGVTCIHMREDLLEKLVIFLEKYYKRELIEKIPGRQTYVWRDNLKEEIAKMRIDVILPERIDARLLAEPQSTIGLKAKLEIPGHALCRLLDAILSNIE